MLAKRSPALRCECHNGDATLVSKGDYYGDDVSITLPDGSQKQVPAGSSPLDVARSIGSRLADDAVVARVNGELRDLTRPFDGDSCGRTIFGAQLSRRTPAPQSSCWRGSPCWNAGGIG